MLTRQQFLIGSALFACWPTGCMWRFTEPSGTLVNDIHSQLNSTLVDRLVRPDSLDSIQRVVRSARAEQKGISITAGRHAMGGQQFGTGTILVDMTTMNRVLNFDAAKGEIEVEAGIQWPELFDYLLRVQAGQRQEWGIIQKQTGADRLSIGGSLSANVHGRGLSLKPFVYADYGGYADVLVDADGNPRICDRRENTELFRLAIGGYGLFGVIATVKLRLGPRTKLERVVEVIESKELMASFDKRIADGYLFGDFQYATDHASDDFLHKGVFSCYRPVDQSTPVPERQKELSAEDWQRLFYLSHAQKGRAFDEYASYYLSTSGQRYWSDTHQLSLYLDDYHRPLDQRLGSVAKGSEMITVKRDDLVRFLEDVRRDFQENKVDLIYGTIRLIERDEESFLAWAKERYVCIIFNLHVVHTPQGLEQAKHTFRHLIDFAIQYGGSYYLTYHRWATRKQVETCYPQFAEFLRLKRKYDPEERFQSDWYRHYKMMFADTL